MAPAPNAIAVINENPPAPAPVQVIEAVNEVQQPPGQLLQAEGQQAAQPAEDQQALPPGPVAAAHPLIAAQVEHNGAKCSVCMDRFIKARLRCDHVYCVPCLESLKGLKRPCPNCRKPFRKWKLLFGAI